jgi:multidrug efflux system outer membrane protein
MSRSSLVALSIGSVLSLASLAASGQPAPASPARPGAASQSPSPAPGAAAPGQAVAPGTPQVAPGTQPPTAAGQTGAGAAGATTVATGPSTFSGPRPIEVNDPLLTPVPPATNVVTDFRQVLTLITTRSPDVLIADQEILRAEGLARQALGRALTQINGTAAVEQSIIPGEITRVTAAGIETTAAVPVVRASITASQPILAPRAWYGIKTAKVSVEAARYSADDRRRTILATVASSILAVVTAERVSEINRVGLRSALERLELTQRRARLGTGTRLDVVRAEQDATLARQQLITGDASLLQTREALGIVLGSSSAYSVPPTISINDIEQAMKSTCSKGKPDERPDVLAAKTQVRVAERSVTDAKLGFLPTADVSTTISYTSQSFADNRHVSWSIQAVLSVPIWNGGIRYGEIRSAEATVEQQKARLDATRRTAELDVTQSTRTVSIAEQARANSERNRDLARETARLTQIAFEAGTGTSFELVEAGRRQREAELDLTVREFELVRAKLAALLATASCKY